MRTIKTLLFALPVILIAAIPASAQRRSTYRDGNGGGRSGGDRSYSNGNRGDVRSFDRGGDRSFNRGGDRSYNNRSFDRSFSNNSRTYAYNNRVNGNNRSYNYEPRSYNTYPRTNVPRVINTPGSYNNRIYRGGYGYGGRYGYNRNYYSYNNYFGYHNYRYGYPGQHIYLNRPTIMINFGGYRYHYLDGIFYRPYGSYFEVCAPPIGIHIGILPYGYRRFWIGPDDYYYYNGIYYRHYDDYYEVVTPPVGAEVAEIPEGSKPVVIDGHKYYEYNGTYYRETPHDNGEMWYTIMGKDGVLTGGPEAGSQDNYSYSTPDDDYSSPSANANPEIGSEVRSLPENTHTVVVNNQKYYVTPDETYYQERIDNNQIYYRVVVKPVVR